MNRLKRITQDTLYAIVASHAINILCYPVSTIQVHTYIPSGWFLLEPPRDFPWGQWDRELCHGNLEKSMKK